MLGDLTDKLESKLSREHLRSLQDKVEQSAEATSEKISETHTNKFNQLN